MLGPWRWGGNLSRRVRARSGPHGVRAQRRPGRRTKVGPRGVARSSPGTAKGPGVAGAGCAAVAGRSTVPLALCPARYASPPVPLSLIRERGNESIRLFRASNEPHLHFFEAAQTPRPLRLVLELDGAPHDEPAQASYDAARTERLQALGYRVRRMPNRDLSRRALEELLRPLLPPKQRAPGAPPSAPSPERERGTGGEVPRDGVRGRGCGPGTTLASLPDHEGST